LPNVGPYIYDVSISGFTRSSIYICDISSLRVKSHFLRVKSVVTAITFKARVFWYVTSCRPVKRLFLECLSLKVKVL